MSLFTTLSIAKPYPHINRRAPSSLSSIVPLEHRNIRTAVRQRCRLATRSLIAVSLLASVGCKKTDAGYMPVTADRAALGFDAGKYVIYKHGKRFPLDSTREAFRCERSAEISALRSQRAIAKFKSDQGTAAAFNAATLLVPVVGLPGAIAYTSSAIRNQRTAVGHAVDAINKHNDSTACRWTDAEAPALVEGAGR